MRRAENRAATKKPRTSARGSSTWVRLKDGTNAVRKRQESSPPDKMRKPAASRNRQVQRKSRAGRSLLDLIRSAAGDRIRYGARSGTKLVENWTFRPVIASAL